MLKKLVPILATLALLAFSGCLDSLPDDKRLYCLDMTEKSYAFVPECNSEKECFSMLQESFFDFEHGVLSNEVQSSLYSYKNNVAASWLYFNKAKSNLGQVNNICSENKNISQLVFHLNELAHNLAKAFEFSDKANRESFSILMLEFSDLEKEDIQMVREEPLYSTYSIISANLSQFKYGLGCLDNQGYSCFYLRQAENFASLVEETGFEGQILSSSNPFELAKPHSSTISGYLESSLEIPFIGRVLSPLLSFLSTLSTTSKAMDLLERMPAFEFMQNYSSFMGTENSGLTRFSAIMKSDVQHRKQLIERNKQLEDLAEKGLEDAKQSISALLSEHYASFDQNFFESLYAGLGQESGFAAQRYSIRDFGELREEAESELSLLSQRLLDLRQKSSLGEISLGGKAALLKELNQDIALLQDNLEYISAEVVSGLIILCEERALSIDQGIQQSTFPQGYAAKASDLKARSSYKLAQFKKAEGTEQKLLACKEMVLEYERFSLSLNEFEQYLLQEELALEECFSFIEKAFGTTEAAGISLDDFILRYHELQSIGKPYPDLENVKRICLSLKSDIESYIRRQPSVKSIEESFSNSQKIISALADLNVSKEEMKALESQLQPFASYFSDESLKLNEALPVMPEIEKGLLEIEQNLEGRLQDLMPEAAILSPPVDFQTQEEQAEAIMQSIQALSQKTVQASELLTVLESLFSNASDEELISAKYIPPISRAELEKIKLKLASMKPFQSKKGLQDFLLLAEQGDLNMALQKSALFEEELGEKLLEANDIFSRLNSAFNALKEDAIVSYNSAAELFNNLGYSQEAEEKLEAAQNSLVKGDYLSSIVESKAASGLIALKPKQSFDLPVFVWPIAIAGGLVLIVRYKKKEISKRKKELFKRIEKNWQ